MIDNAQWIWCNDSPESENQHGHFRRTIELDQTPSRATVQCCADTYYRLYINGQYVGFGPSRYHRNEPAYDTYDIAGLLRPGRNVIAFHVHAYGQLKRCSSCIPIRGGLIAAIGIDDDQIIITDSQWKTYNETAYQSDTPRLSNHQGFIECFDARMAMGGWQLTEYDDADWARANVLGRTEQLPPWHKLVPRGVPLLTHQARTPSRVIEFGKLVYPEKHNPNDLVQLAPGIAAVQRIAAPDAVSFNNPTGNLPITLHDGFALFDFAENNAGFVTIYLSGNAGTVVDLAYSESITDGEIESNKQGVRYIDRIILGDRPITHTITLPKTFRYLLVTADGQATVHEVRHDVSHYPVRWHGRFHSSDEVLDATWRVGAHTVAISMEDVYLDTPRRERAGWLGDMMPEAIAAYHAFGDYQLAAHSLDLYFKSQNMPGLYMDYPTDKPGWILSRYPSIDPDPMPDYNASIALTVHDYVTYSGGVSFATDHWNELTAVIGYVESHRNDADLIEFRREDQIKGAYVLIDWAPLDRTGACTSLNLLHLGQLRAMSDLGTRIGKAADAQRFHALADRLQHAIATKLFDDKRGIFVNGLINGERNTRAGYQENLLALIWHPQDSKQNRSIQQQLLSEGRPLPMWEPEENYEMYQLLHRGEVPAWDDDELVPIGSPYFTYFALWALFESGHAVAALETIRSQYGGCLARGATTVWEEWNGSKSHSHGWGAGPTAHLLKYVVGIAPTSPGFKTFDVLPDFANLTHASGAVPTPYGSIQVQWRRDGNSIELTAVVPENTTARIGLPIEASQFDVNGRTQQAMPLKIRRGNYSTVRLSSGEYCIRATMPS